MIISAPFPQRRARRAATEAALRIPRHTTLPLAASDAAITVLVDDENVRLAAELELGGLVPHYGRLAHVCAASFHSVDVHVFTARDRVDDPIRASRTEQAEIHVHRKRVDGKNVDMEVALWLARRLYGRYGTNPTHVLFVTGDIDYLALAAAATDSGAEIGFLAAPGRSLAHALRSLPHGLLGLDVLLPPRRATLTRWSTHPLLLTDNGWRPPSPRVRRTRFLLDGGAE